MKKSKEKKRAGVLCLLTTAQSRTSRQGVSRSLFFNPHQKALSTRSNNNAGSSPVAPAIFSFVGILKAATINGILRKIVAFFLSAGTGFKGDGTEWESIQDSINSRTSFSTSKFPQQMRSARLCATKTKASIFYWNRPSDICTSALLIIICKILFALMLCLSIFLRVSFAQTGSSYLFSHDNCIKALVGEVEGESFQCKLATAEALRNRGSLKGVYGINSPRIKKAPRRVFDDCTRAWLSVTRSKTNYVRGATVWGSAQDLKSFKKQSWFQSYEFVCKVGNHYFYRRLAVHTRQKER